MSTAAPIPPIDGGWVDAWLGTPRLGRYLTAAGSDRWRALALYEWNAQVSAAFQRDLSHVEIALRNAYDQAATAHWTGPGHWLLDDSVVVFAPVHRTKKVSGGPRSRRDINAKPRTLVAQAIKKAGGSRATPGKVVAELPFGFWRYLSSSAHEKTLWVPMLHHAFPARTNRAIVDAEIGRLHDLRNRVAHHEPLLNEDILARHADAVSVASRLHQELADHLRSTSRIQSLASVRP